MPSALPRRSIAAVLVALAAACTQVTQAPPPVLDKHPATVSMPSASATAPAPTTPPPKPAPSAPAAPAKAARGPEIAAWTDPGAIAQLVRNCGWAPAKDEEGSDALSCAIQVDQTCNWNECDGEAERCRDGCTSTCEGCGASCAKGCEACKSTCKDEACRRTCAERCGSCRQACLQTKDHCASGECAQVASACSEKLAADWGKSPCTQHVDKFKKCVDACVTKLGDKASDFSRLRGCQDTCENRFLSGCGRFFSFYRVY
ncbi:MAG: hypothetical protein QM820_23025 [Minicystis sp.]